jgi:hypothetical protein
MKIYFLISLIAMIVLLACKAATKKSESRVNHIGDDLSDFEGALYPVSVKGKWGYMNNRFEIVIKPQFDYAEDFSGGIAVVAKQHKEGNNLIELFGYIDTIGNMIVECRYEKAYDFSEGLAAIVQNGKYGFVDKNGLEVIPVVYEEASEFSEGLAAVKLNGKNGFINPKGEMVIAPQFARACWVSDFSEGLAAVYTSDEGGGGYINRAGKMIIPAAYNYVGSFSEGLAQVQPAGSTKYGYIDRNGEMVIKPQYELSLPFSEGVATVQFMQPDGKAVFRIIDKKGGIIADHLPYAFTGIFREGLAGVESFDHLWGFIDKTGKEVIKPQFAGAKLFRNGLSRMETGHLFSGLKTVYINKKGKIVWSE